MVIDLKREARITENTDNFEVTFEPSRPGELVIKVEHGGEAGYIVFDADDYIQLVRKAGRAW